MYSDASSLARIIWDTSRADEGTISATGADIVAKAILDSDWLSQERANAIADFVNRQAVVYNSHSANAIEEDIALAIAEFGVSRSAFSDEQADTIKIVDRHTLAAHLDSIGKPLDPDTIDRVLYALLELNGLKEY